MPTLTIIIGSTRPGRAGLPIANWFADQARAQGGFDVQIADLAELALPFMDEAQHPLFRQYDHDHTKKWSALVDGSDAFVIVSPEYNHGYAAPIKNAIDYLHAEWYYKPVGFVSYGGVSGGTRAVGQLKSIVAALKMTPLTESVIIPNHSQHLDESGVFQSNDGLNFSALGMLAELAKMEAALRPLR
jgi:NAD(P)H-dependent FMN reductase